MLPSRNRLRKGFLRIYKDKKKVVNPMFLLFYKENEKGYPRVGFVIRKKLGKAHLRNKVKREFRSIVREKLTDDDNFKSMGCDFIFLVNHNLTKLDSTKKESFEWGDIKYIDIKTNIINAFTEVSVQIDKI